MTAILVGVGLVVGALVTILLIALSVEQMVREYSAQRGLKL